MKEQVGRSLSLADRVAAATSSTEQEAKADQNYDPDDGRSFMAQILFRIMAHFHCGLNELLDLPIVVVSAMWEEAEYQTALKNWQWQVAVQSRVI
ncbi:hypothetical protein [Microcystis phage Mvi-JY20]|uniref:Uncharacterized protein n=1 Tax=Microcystis phage Mvi-JY20 TaxID=3128146 RepID=A0AAX4QH77_9CAUD